MGLSVAVGGRSSSSKILPSYLGTKNNKNSISQRLVTVSVNHDSSLCVKATFLYPSNNGSSDHDGILRESDHDHYDYVEIKHNDEQGESKDGNETSFDFEEIHESKDVMEDHSLDSNDEKLFAGEALSENNVREKIYLELVLEINSLYLEQSSNMQMPKKTYPWRFRIPLSSFDNKPGLKAPFSKAALNMDPQVLFSSDGRYLACLIPPYFNGDNIQTSSTLAIFNLRKAPSNMQTTNELNLPLPSFIDEKSNSTSTKNLYPNMIPPIIKDPRIVKLQPDAYGDGNIHDLHFSMNLDFTTITTICDASAPSGTSFLLASCQDGSILAINYKSARLTGVLYCPKEIMPQKSLAQQQHLQEQTEKHAQAQKRSHIISMTHYSAPCSNISAVISETNQSFGRLATIRADGSIIIYTSLFESVIATEMNSINSNGSMMEGNLEKVVIRSNSNSSNSALYRQTSDQSFSSYNSIEANSETIEKQYFSLEEPVLKKKSIRSKNRSVIMTIDPLVVIESQIHVPPFFRHAYWINFSTIAFATGGNDTNKKQIKEDKFSNIVTQVWSIANNGDIFKLSELKMTEDILEQEKHGQFDPQSKHIYNSERHEISSNGKKVSASKSSNVTGLDFDSFSGCLAISGQIHKRGKTLQEQFVCIWDWTSNVLGLTLTSRDSICHYSKLIFGHGGRLLCHFHICDDVREIRNNIQQEKNNSRLRKDIYKMGVLSPSSTAKMSYNTNHNGGWIEGASTIFLSSNSVSVPFISQSTCILDKTLEWKEFVIPSVYVHEYGPAIIAAIGDKMGRSVAVASSRGLCILDLHRMKNKLESTRLRLDSVVKSKILKYKKHLPRRNKYRPSPCVEHATSAQSQHSWLKEKFLSKNTKHKWRMIGNQDMESSFRVHAMVWWERDIQRINTKEAILINEDLLIAVIEYMPNTSPDKYDKSLYLVCWSRRWLGLGEHQLLEEANYGKLQTNLESNTSTSRKGIRLPNDLRPDSISILTEPQNKNIDDRALILVSSTPASSSDEPAYAAFQLQTLTYSPGSSSGLNNNEIATKPRTKHIVYGKLASHGYIPCLSDLSASVSCSCTGIFLAGGSFNFDLCEELEELFEDHANEYIATLGVIKTDGGGLDSVVIGSSGPLYSGSVLLNNCRAKMKEYGFSSGDLTQLAGVAKYWLSDVVETKGLVLSDESESEDECTFYEFFVWTIALTDGTIFTWSAPFLTCDKDSPSLSIDIHINNKSQQNGLKDDVSKEPEKNKRSLSAGPSEILPCFESSLNPSSTVMPRVVFNFDGSTIFCDIVDTAFLGFSSCILGDSSLWMNGVKVMGRNETAVGPLPFTSSRCLIYTGQHYRQLRQCIPSLGGSNGSNLLVELFGLTDCTVSSPAFTASILSSILDLSFLSISNPVISCDDPDHTQLKVTTSKRNLTLREAIVIGHHVESIFQYRYDEGILTSLKVLILRASEFYSDVSSLSKSSKVVEHSSNTKALSKQFAKSILHGIISIAKQVLCPLEFSSLFLGIGRQIEPHLFDILFPLLPQSPFNMITLRDSQNNTLFESSNLPLSNQSKTNNKIAVEDLFYTSLKFGSICIAASALPIFRSQRNSHLQCLRLLESCLDSIGNSHVFKNTNMIINPEEAKHVLEQLFHFALKLEDAEGSHLELEDEESSSCSESEDDGKTSDDYSFDEISTSGENSEDISWKSTSCDEECSRDYENNHVNIRGDFDSNKSDSFVKIAYNSSDIAPEKNNIRTDIGVSQIKDILIPKQVIDEKAIQSAASSFILSGFDAQVNNMANGSRNTHLVEDVTLSNSKHPKSLVKTNGSVLEATSQYLTSIAFSKHSDTFGIPNGWKSIATIAQILMKDRSLSSIHSATSTLLEVLVHSLQNIDAANHLFGLEEDHIPTEHKKDNDLPGGKWFFVGRIMECMQQIDDKNSDHVFKLALFLLSQNIFSNEIEYIRTGLAVLVIVSGHVSGSLYNTLGESWEATVVGKYYTLAAKEIVRVL